MANEHCNFNVVSFYKIPSNYYLSVLMVLGNRCVLSTNMVATRFILENIEFEDYL